MERRAAKIALLREQGRVGDRVGQRIARGGVEKAAAKAQPRDLLPAPQAVHIARQDHRQHPAFFVDDIGLPAADPRRGLVDPIAQRVLIERRLVRIISVLDQQLGVADRELVDEPITVDLLDHRVHDDRPANAVRLGESIDASGELLPCQRDPGHCTRPARVEHGIGLKPLAALERDRSRIDAKDPPAEPILVGPQRLPHRRVEVDGADAVVPGGDGSAAPGEMDVIVRPPAGGDAVQHPAMLAGDVTVEERPNVIATEQLGLLDQHQLDIGAAPGNCHRSQAAGEPAAGNQQAAHRGSTQSRMASGAKA